MHYFNVIVHNKQVTSIERTIRKLADRELTEPLRPIHLVGKFLLSFITMLI